MSDANLARRTIVEVAFDGVDITDSISQYLLSLSYTDTEEDSADDLQIKLHDREGIWLTSWLEQAINAAAAAPEYKTDANYKVSAESGLCVRSGPGAHYSQYGSLAYEDEVFVNGSVGDWSIIIYKGKSAYVETKYLTPLTTDSGTMPTLTFGSSGTAVTTLQEHLTSLGYNLGRVDGSFGNRTQSAVAAFQGDHSLPPDGVCGPSTWAAIFAAVNALVPGQETTKKVGLSISAAITLVNANSDGVDRKLECGVFELDSVDSSGPPSAITIKATALPFTAQIRQTKKTKGWESYHLSGIAKEMASANGMSCMFLSNTDPFYHRVEQFATSDISFLQILAHAAGLSLKVTNNIIVLFDQVSFEATPPVLTIRRGDKSYTKWKVGTKKSDTNYTSCRVSWTKTDGTLIQGVAKVKDYDEESKSNQQLEITAKAESIAEATALAEKMLRLHNKYQKTASFTLPGNPALLSGLTIQLEDWGAWSGKYIISQAKHNVSNSYTVQIELRKILEGY